MLSRKLNALPPLLMRMGRVLLLRKLAEGPLLCLDADVVPHA